MLVDHHCCLVVSTPKFDFEVIMSSEKEEPKERVTKERMISPTYRNCILLSCAEHRGTSAMLGDPGDKPQQELDFFVLHRRKK
jgi:hypothetical protein